MNDQASIVIPTFNRADFVKKAIDSSLAQTVKCQVIVCDHGSSDQTPQVAASYGDAITYIRREHDFGPHYCWLEGVMHATTPYIHMQFDDDWIAEDYMEKSLALMAEDVGVVMAYPVIVDEATGNHSDSGVPFRGMGMQTGVYSNRILHRQCIKKKLMVSPGASVFRKQDVIDALYQGGLPLKTNDEYHGVGPDAFMTYLTLLRYKKFGYINEDLVFFRSHEGSITVDAAADVVKKKKIKHAYKQVRNYYRLLAFYQRFKQLLDVVM
tara:strand:+ start:1146 stop:1946 length:801 start_codon:yes stop_codon:yes gene_type:complete